MYMLLVLSVMAAALNSMLLHKLPASKNIFAFNFYGALLWIVILTMANGMHISLSREVVWWGTAYGAVQVLFLVFKAKAMASGPVSITTLIGNCSMLLSVAASLLLWKEKVSAGQILGLVCLMVSVFLCTHAKSEMQMTGQWKVNCILFFVLAAGVGIVFKGFSRSGAQAMAGDMMLFSSVVMALALCIILLLQKSKKKDAALPKTEHSYGMLVICCGILSCIYNRLNISLSGALPGMVFFPCFNGGVIIVSGLLGKFVLKEKLTLRQNLGLVMGTMAVLVIGIF
ncbi:MAG: hypothetical protein IJ390_11685 [Lachnospiraceae bacterium]|nr:hypothetical protein [Lachnospiraceae bacterium]